MAIQTAVPAGLRRPTSFHQFIHSQAGRGLLPLPQRVVLVGIQFGGATADVGVPFQVFDALEADRLFGAGSELALMVRAAFTQAKLQGTSPEIWACPLDEPSGAVAKTTIAIEAQSTPGGTLVLQVAGRTLVIGVSPNDTAPTIAMAIRREMMRLAADLPISPTVTAGVVTSLHAVAGENGNDVAYRLSEAPAGVSVTITKVTAGSGVADIGPALDALVDKQYDAIAFGNHKSADATKAVAHTSACWGFAEKKYRWAFFGERGSLGTATALASANDKTIIVVSCEDTPSLPGEIAAMAAVRAFGTDRPNANFDGSRLALYPPPPASVYTASEVEAALAAGVTPLTPMPDGMAVRIERLITTKITENGAPFEALLDLAYSRTAAFLARQIDAAYAERFQDEVIDGDGELLARVRDMVIEIHRAAQTARYLRDVDSFLAAIRVEEAVAPAGRLLTVAPFRVANPLHQAVFVHHHYL